MSKLKHILGAFVKLPVFFLKFKKKARKLKVNDFICGVLPRDCYLSTNRFYLKNVNEILKLKCVRFLFGYIVQDTDWTLANGPLNLELFSSDRIHLVGKGNSKLSGSISKSIKDFYDTANINYCQLTKSYKMAVAICRFLCHTSCKSEFVVIKRHTVNNFYINLYCCIIPTLLYHQLML